MTLISEPTQLTLLERAVDVVTGSEHAQDLCRRLVHADFTEGQVKGAFIFSIDSRSVLIQLAGYGKAFDGDIVEYSLWDDHALTECVRKKSIVCQPQKDQTLICLPFFANGIPTGALVVVCSPEVKSPSFGDEALPVLSKLGGFFLSTTSTLLPRLNNSPSKPVSIEEITTRQLEILSLMAEGLTNAEIAAKVLLSESTVRQETIRIYRSLAVGGRLEAVAKGRALGLISKIAPPPPELDALTIPPSGAVKLRIPQVHT